MTRWIPAERLMIKIKRAEQALHEAEIILYEIMGALKGDSL